MAATAAEDQVAATTGDDRFVAGDTVVIDHAVEGDTFVAAGHGAVHGRVGGDAVITGGEVELEGEVGHDVYAAGGFVRANSRVQGNLRLAGARIEVGPASDVLGSATLAGRTIDVEGRIGHALAAFGRTVTLDAEVGGDVEIAARDVIIGPKARIAGRFTYRSPHEARIDPAAQIAGGIVRAEHSPQHWGWYRGPARAIGAIAYFFWFVGVLVLGTLLVFVFPSFSRESAALVRSDPLASAALGFAVFVAVPAGIVLCFITIIGIPLGIAGMFGYGLLLMLGYLNGALAIGDVLLGRLGEPRAGSAGWRIVFLLLALVALALLRHLPWVGAFAVFVVFVAGLGAWTLRAWRGYSGPERATGP